MLFDYFDTSTIQCLTDIVNVSNSLLSQPSQPIPFNLLRVLFTIIHSLLTQTVSLPESILRSYVHCIQECFCCCNTLYQRCTPFPIRWTLDLQEGVRLLHPVVSLAFRSMTRCFELVDQWVGIELVQPCLLFMKAYCCSGTFN